MIVKLDHDEIMLIFERAKERHETKNGIVVADWGKHSLQRHYEGCRAEYAVERDLGGVADWSVRPGGDNGEPDIFFPHLDMTGQVKYRGQRGWDFALRTNNILDFRADLGILVWPADGDDVRSTDYQSVDIVGYITQEQFKERAIVKGYGYGDRLVVEANQLQPAEELAPHGLQKA